MIYDTINKYHIVTRFYGRNIWPVYESIQLLLKLFIEQLFDLNTGTTSEFRPVKNIKKDLEVANANLISQHQLDQFSSKLDSKFGSRLDYEDIEDAIENLKSQMALVKSRDQEIYDLLSQKKRPQTPIILSDPFDEVADVKRKQKYGNLLKVSS